MIKAFLDKRIKSNHYPNDTTIRDWIRYQVQVRSFRLWRFRLVWWDYGRQIEFQYSTKLIFYRLCFYLRYKPHFRYITEPMDKTGMIFVGNPGKWRK